MSHGWKWIGEVIALPLTVCVCLVVVAGQLPNTPTLSLEAPKRKCAEPPIYRVGYQRESNGLQTLANGFSFQGLSWLEAELCSPGMLILTADGEIADDEPPVLNIAINSTVLAKEAFDKQRTVSLHVPEAGQLRLGYFNDYYLSDARVATLEGLRMTALACQAFKVEMPPATGDGWTPSTSTATLVSGEAMTITPCADGELTLRVLGRAGGKAFPTLEFMQNNRLVLRIATLAVRQPVRLKIAAAPLTVRMTNPYFEQLADRNLNLRLLQFRPDPPNSP